MDVWVTGLGFFPFLSRSSTGNSTGNLSSVFEVCVMKDQSEIVKTLHVETHAVLSVGH